MALVLWCAACAAPGATTRPGPPAVIAGTVKSVKGRPLEGLVLLERGELHGNVWDGGTLLKDGVFRVEVPSGGQYGLHIYASGYFYRPQAIRVEPGQTLTVDVRLAPEPIRTRDPVIRRAGFATDRQRPGTRVTLEVTDPDNNLGPQVMAFDAKAGRAYAMNPPTPMRDLKANFPSGQYWVEQNTAAGPADPRDWYFVVADHACFTSDILAFPHTPTPPQVVRE
jgi:hypothetical protein